MGEVLARAGKAALRACIPLVLILATGFLAAKNLGDVRLQATAFAVGVAIVVFTTFSAIVPQLSWRSYVSEAYAKYLDAVTQAFVGTFFALAIGFLGAPDWANWRAAVVGILVGAGNAAVRALQALFTSGEPLLDPVKEPKAKPKRVSLRPSLA